MEISEEKHEKHLNVTTVYDFEHILSLKLYCSNCFGNYFRFNSETQSFFEPGYG